MCCAQSVSGFEGGLGGESVCTKPENTLEETVDGVTFDTNTSAPSDMTSKTIAFNTGSKYCSA